ncbi:MAG: hypothetical protein JSU77_09115 [Fidelibacterota bacterium]|nr:MAG: hypothetical protein JSU77_09115 [Candidatus Neomarinimicrobiota bacterium]
MKARAAILIGLALLLVPLFHLEAQIPGTLSYQAFLSDSLGVPKADGAYTITFGLYNVETGGTALWTETKDLEVKQGLFYTHLGPFPSSLRFDQPYWLGIQVGSEAELAPRIPLTSVGYSFMALRSDSAQYALLADSAQYTKQALRSDSAQFAVQADTAKVATSALAAADLADDAVTSGKIADGTISTVDLADNAVTPAKIDTTGAAAGQVLVYNGESLTWQPPPTSGGSITTTELADNAVTSTKILDGAVTTAKILDGDVTSGDLADNAVTSTKILDGAVVAADLADNAVTSAKILDGAVVAADLADNAVTGAKITDGAIAGEDISATAAVTVASLTTAQVGTTDPAALELRVNGTNALRLEPHSTSPNIIGGYSGNSVGADVYGATIGGGGSDLSTNQVTSNYGTVGGGNNNIVNGERATIGGGHDNIADGSRATISGGKANQASGYKSFIGGGHGNQASGWKATIGGGNANLASGWNATVPGGNSNVAGGGFSFAAGRRAKANHDGAFVWADTTDEDFASTAANQFLIRASGGVGIGTANPGATLDVAGNVRIPNDQSIAGNSGNDIGYLDIAKVGTSNELIIGHGNNSDLQFVTGGTSGIPSMVIANGGNVGIGTDNPGSVLDVNGTANIGGLFTTGGGHVVNVVSKTESYTTLTSDRIILCATQDPDFPVTITLHSAVGVRGQLLSIRNIKPSDPVTITPSGGETIDGMSEVEIYLSAYDDITGITLVSDGAGWWIISDVAVLGQAM